MKFWGWEVWGREVEGKGKGQKGKGRLEGRVKGSTKRLNWGKEMSFWEV